MKKTTIIYTLIILLISFSACSNHVRLKALKPAQIQRVSEIKNIAVLDFAGDGVALASKIESNLAKHKIDNKAFFTVVNRSAIDDIIREQKLQNSGLVDEGIVEAGNLLGAHAIISGNVSRLSVNDSRYHVTRSACADKKCKELYYYKVRCTQRDISLSADIKMVDVRYGDIIHSENIARSATYKRCSDDGRGFPTTQSVGERLALSIASSFTYKLTPQYKYFNVELLEDPDLDYTDKQEDLLEHSIEYVEQNRYDKAAELLRALIDSTAQQSYVAFYNLGVIEEAQGNYEQAKMMYERADRLTTKPVEAVNIAINRIDAVIQEHNLTMQQMQR